MFGFVKTIQGFFSKLKQNKRWWFTFLFLIATVGISLSIAFLVVATDTVSKEVYVSQAKQFELMYKEHEKLKAAKLKKMASLITYESSIVDKIESNDVAAISKFENDLNIKLAQLDDDLMMFKFYSLANTNGTRRNSIISAIQNQNSIFGLEVLFDGVFYVYIEPILKNDKVVGVLEIKESIHSIAKSFQRTKKQFAFLLDTKMIAIISEQYKKGIYQEIGTNHLVNNKVYNTTLIASISSLQEDTLQTISNQKYIVNQEFFLNGLVLRDTNGVDIGIAVLGESTVEDDSFINMAKKMTNQVVTVALGLIVSLLLFMF